MINPHLGSANNNDATNFLGLSLGPVPKACNAGTAGRYPVRLTLTAAAPPEFNRVHAWGTREIYAVFATALDAKSSYPYYMSSWCVTGIHAISRLTGRGAQGFYHDDCRMRYRKQR